MKAKTFLDKKQNEHFKKHGVYADVNSKIAEWMEQYLQTKLKEIVPSDEEIVDSMIKVQIGDKSHNWFIKWLKQKLI